jgi:hypothetical protein
MVKKLYEWQPISTRLAGRPKIIWENDIKEYLRIMKINNWTKCIQEWVMWKEVVEKSKPFKQ